MGAPGRDHSDAMDSCPYCDGPLSAGGVRLGYHVGTCRACGSLACLDEVGEDVLAALYGDPGYYTGGCAPYGYDGNFRRNDGQRAPAWERRLSALGALTPGRRLLELGPGKGGFLRLARRRGWDVAAVDPYPAEGLPVPVFPSVEAALGDGPYDAVCLFDVLEHVRRPLLLLEQVRAALAPDGCAAVGLPSVDGPSFRALGTEWCEVKPPEHLSLPSAEGMRRALERSQLAVRGIIGHFRETWLWEPLRPLLEPPSSHGRSASASHLGARALNRAVREIRTRLPAPPPEGQDYVTWLAGHPAVPRRGT